ncbi:hypothetical protein J5X98_04450 [Leptothermofonsia sichuanensis E412]|uniref:hypothetical protein n=1 Tax=Leptothermofonsia sichuanensis TaxID=2917832 RepID=UPI001CA63696|nr:hypothetical protein [Leptothermofonsia sichuanensis]QZZ21710.1 hypothetical protein J5X98_04450 [Leptothermofonsia sichuanensis E412]
MSRFDPDRASLSTWTARLVKQHHDLNAFLLERGLCLLSDWAILNDTTQKKLNRVLTQFHHLTEQEVHQASRLLDSYHAVYRRDRILQGQKGQCPEPKEPQLKAIADLIQEKTQQPYPPAIILSRLHHLADRLRQHRISTRGGIPPAKSFDQPENASLLESLQTKSSDDQEEPQIEFLQFYRQQFLTSLETALEGVMGDRLQALKPPKDQSFRFGLRRSPLQDTPTATWPIWSMGRIC